MNTRKAVAAAFGAALLGAGTSAVLGGHAAHGQLDKNITGSATSSQHANGGTSSATCLDCSASVDASTTLKNAVGLHHSAGRISQKVGNKTSSSHANGSTHGSAKSGSQKFHIG